MDSLLQDLRYAARQIRRTPLLSVVVILVLTIGIGTNAIIFAVLDGIFFRPPPGVGSTDGLVEVQSVAVSGRSPFSSLTWREFLEYRDARSVFEEFAAYRGTGVALRTDQGPEVVSAELVSSNYFATLEVDMVLGPGFTPGDDRQGSTAAHAVLGFAHWQRQMAGAADVIGRRIEVNGRPHTVVGVAPERFHGARGGDDPVDLWLPAADVPVLFPDDQEMAAGEQRAFRAVGRLAEGVSVARAEAVTQAIWQNGVAPGLEGADAEDRRIDITPYRGFGSLTAGSGFLFVGVVGGLIGGIILLIACVNVSGLFLGRALGRRREIGVRLALGAGRARIVRQLLTESALLALIAGVAALLLTTLGLDVLEAALFTFPLDLAPGLGTVGLTVAVVGATGLAFGLTPALHATRASVFTAMKDNVAGLDRRSSRIRGAFTVAQLALSLPLLTAAGLLVAQLLSRTTGDYGFSDPQNVLTLRIDMARSGYAPDEIGPLLTELRERAEGLPGVAGAAFTSVAPFTGFHSSRLVRLSRPDSDPGAAVGSTLLRFAVVDPEYFSTAGISILRGRGIESHDVAGAPVVAVVDEDVAERAWPGEDPIGRTFTVGAGEEETAVTVVGVADRVRMETDPAQETPVIYGARRQLPDTASMALVVRAAGGAAAVVPGVRSAVRAVDPDLVSRLNLLSERLRSSRTELAHASVGAVACGVIALLLACVGLYGMIAAGVTERTREIGIRIALGADRARVVLHFVRQGLLLALIALGIGLPLAWAAVALVGVGVVGVGAMAPEVAAGLAATAALLIIVALLSSWLPARRTTSVDPASALRTE